MTHRIALKTRDGSPTQYRIETSNGISKAGSADPSDTAADSTASGTVAGGVDAFDYGGKRTLAETDDLDNLLVNIDWESGWNPAEHHGFGQTSFGDDADNGTHTITIDDDGGDEPNNYKIVFSRKPERAGAHGASTNGNDAIYRTPDGNWAAQGQVYGGRDAYAYNGKRIRHVVEFPDRLRFQINDKGWQPATDFRTTQRDDWPGESGGDTGGDTSTDTTGPSPETKPPGDPEARGPHAAIRDADLSDWDVVDLDSSNSLAAAVDRHGTETVYRLWSDVDITDTLSFPNGRVAVVGKGTSQSTIHAHGKLDSLFRLGDNGDRAGGVLLRNLDVDVTDATVEKGLIQAFAAGDGVYAKDLVLRGRITGPGDVVTCVTDSDSVVELERLRAPEGAERTWRADSFDDSVGVIMAGPSDGTLRMHACELGPFPNNGVYCSGQRKHGHDGRAVITAHTGHGSDRDQLRVGNDSVIAGADLWATKSREGFDNLRGIWARYARGAEIRNVRIKTHDADPGEAIRIDSTSGRVTIEGFDIELRSSHRAARGVCAYSPSSEAGDDTDITIHDGRIHGDGTPRDAVLIKSGRSDSTVENVDIDLPDEVEEVDHR